MSFPNPFTLPTISNDQGAGIVSGLEKVAQEIIGSRGASGSISGSISGPSGGLSGQITGQLSNGKLSEKISGRATRPSAPSAPAAPATPVSPQPGPGQTQSPGQSCPFGQLLTPANAPIDATYIQNLKGTGKQFHDIIAPKACSFDALFQTYQAEIAKENAGHPNADQVANLIKQAIQDIVKTIQVPDFVLLCMIMQESRGNVYVKSTTDADGKPNGGLLQCEGGAGWNGKDTMGLEQITNDIKAGAQHFKSNLDQAKNDVFQALRLYNSGSVAPSGDLSDPTSVGTPSYVADVANKMHGCLGTTGH